MYYGCLKVFMMSSSLYHTVINILDIIYVSVMEIDFEDVKWIPSCVKKQELVVAFHIFNLFINQIMRFFLLKFSIQKPAKKSHKLISLIFGWLPALIFSIAPLFLESIFFRYKYLNYKFSPRGKWSSCAHFNIAFSMNLNSYTAVMDGNPRLILTLEFFAALLPHFLIICLSRKRMNLLILVV